MRKLPRWTAKDVVKATSAALIGREDWEATGLSIDTRTLEPGDIFVALEGEGADGHDYAAQALEKGAAALLLARIPDDLPKDAPVLHAQDGDVLAVLRGVAAAARDRSGATRIAITGSVGKTSTKEMLAMALRANGQTHAATKSFNNHIGVPVTLAGLQGGDDYGVFEIGMNHPGEIGPLAELVRPHIALITKIAAVHIGHMSTIDAIRAEKAEIFKGLTENGIAIIPGDDEHTDALREAALEYGAKEVLTFGEGEDCDCRMSECLCAANGTRFKARVMDEDVTVSLQIPGAHQAHNALAVLLAAKVAGADLQKAAAALKAYHGYAGRGLQEKLDIGDPDNPVTLIDESYNASPEAMRAAFRVLALIDPGRGGRRIAVLGDMRELGKDGPRLHKDLALPIKAANIDLVYTCGPLMKNLHEELPKEQQGAHRETSVELAKIVPDVLVPGDVVMVKGSLGTKMAPIVEALRTLPSKRKKT